MSLQHAAKHLASKGRGPDTELIHMTKGEINGLQQLAMAGGGSLTINPHTGLVEAGFLSKMLPMIAGAAAMYFSGGTAAPLIAGMSNAATIGLGMGAFETARTGSIQKGLMAGMGAYGGAGLAGGLMGAGAQQVAGETLAKEGIAAGEVVPANFAETAGRTATPAQLELARTGASSADLMSKGVGSLGQSGGFANLGNTMATSGGPSLGRAGFALAAPMLLQSGNQQPQTPVGDNVMPQRLQYNPGIATNPQTGQPYTPPPDVPGYDNLGQDFGKQQNYFPTAGYQNITPEQAKAIRGYAGGGPVEAMSNSNALGINTDYPLSNAFQGTFANAYQTPVPQNVVRGATDTGVNSMTGEMNEFAEGGLNLSGEYSRNLKDELENTYAKAERSGDKSTMRSVKSESELRERIKNPKMYAAGGLSAAASHLGDYSDGGRLLKGPGDGVSDSIPATIGNKRPARLADGEFVVPARIVSELGNGSTEAGARKLYAMLDRVQSARKKSIGKGKVAKNSRADNLLPA
jgi:hypothetical protein